MLIVDLGFVEIILIKTKPSKTLSSAIDGMICIRNTHQLINTVKKTLIVFIVCSGHKMTFTDVSAKQKNYYI